jgi:hypothetical protein
VWGRRGSKTYWPAAEAGVEVASLRLEADEVGIRGRSFELMKLEMGLLLLPVPIRRRRRLRFSLA